MVAHYQSCTVRTHGGCMECMKFVRMVHYHARVCKAYPFNLCPVPRCADIRVRHLGFHVSVVTVWGSTVALCARSCSRGYPSCAVGPTLVLDVQETYRRMRYAEQLKQQRMDDRRRSHAMRAAAGERATVCRPAR